jgi:hypothetical protein
MDLDTLTIYGERAADLLPALKVMAESATVDGHGGMTFEVRLEKKLAQPVFRAVMRAEAELLLEDAALGTDGYEERTQAQRTADALVRVAKGFLRASDEGPQATPCGTTPPDSGWSRTSAGS